MLRNYEWVHLTLGLMGNVCFVVGSVFFLYEALKIEGTWLFIIGSSGMLIGAVGSAGVKLTWRVAHRTPSSAAGIMIRTILRASEAATRARAIEW